MSLAFPRTPFRRAVVTVVLASATSLMAAASLIGQTTVSPASHSVLDEVIPPGNNFDKAQFRFWVPEANAPVRATLVLVPGSNGDGRAQAEDSVWQAFATKHRVALVGCQFTDRPHDQNFIEAYVNVSQGSGQALLDALGKFAERSHHPEVVAAPLLLWGMSAGGQFNYEFAAWKPERVAAFVVNKGGIYYSALVSKAARDVPALLFVGGKDLEFRTNTIVGLFAVNRRGGALWALTEEPGAAHVVGRSRDMSIVFFEDVLPLRLGAPDARGIATLMPLNPRSGFVGDLKSRTFQPAAGMAPPVGPTAWLPTERVARAWQAVVADGRTPER